MRTPVRTGETLRSGEAISAYGTARSTVEGTPLSPDELRKVDAYWRASLYLCLGMLYLKGNPLLREPLTLDHVKSRLLGHWGSDAGQAFTYTHFNRLINKYDLNAIYISGPGDEAAALDPRFRGGDGTHFTKERTGGMSELLSNVYLARHGETAWSLSGQHTGRTDLPLTERGERNARALGERLWGMAFATVYTSPLQRAVRTCELAGFGRAAEIDPDLVEWDYDEYEGRRTAEIHAERPDWRLFRDGCPGGESPDQIGARADRVVGRVRAVKGDVLVFSSGHFLRVLAAGWLGLEAAAGRYLLLSTASLSALGYEHHQTEPAIRLWNETRHVET